ncbi:FAD-binding and (Fe-S)-binding domain-containing protein [Streptomyces sioyaensis]|uniref:FAD-binding and (Fe-S)-binding domain-containing protein n=1 Tax=Streptomyces sioyaensis TaxID=67364 RepID=UPI0037D4888C
MPLFVPKSGLLRPATQQPAPDRLPEERESGTPEPLRRDLVALLGEGKVLHKVSDLVKYASDASPYRFVPQVVVIAESVEDISALFGYANAHGRKIVFRAAGTSLNGQSQGEDILVDVRRHWEGIEVLAGGARARVRPGTTVVKANVALARHGRLMGPDPASAQVACVGGVVANNACGMTAGTTRNSYKLLSAVTFVLPSGTVVDTGAPDADDKLRQAEPRLCEALMALREEIESDARMVARIRAKYELKNTNGYRLDAFLDGRTPVEILRGLAVGSEGTLGFIADTVFDTVPLDRFTASAMLFFPTLREAAAAVPRFNEAGARAVELMDGNTLRACAAVEGVPADWADVPAATTVLLVEFRAPDEATRIVYEQAAAEVLRSLDLVAPVASVTNQFVRDPKVIHSYWHAREAFVTAVGKARPSGTTLITEDFAVPPSQLADACQALLELQREYGFDAAVAGHAAHGNLHFCLAFDSSHPEDVQRYADFMNAFCTMAIERFDGALKAEHATGRNIAPWLELEWGKAATDLMWRIKSVLDPNMMLGPGVVLDRDPNGFLRGLKTIPTIEVIADSCIECGFCEAVCPSHDLTTSPRQRIVLRREMMRQPTESPVMDRLLGSYGYDAVDTCAGDSTCKIACPVGIDTGAMMKDFRHQRHSAREEKSANWAVKHFGVIETGARAALAVASHTSDALLSTTTKTVRKLVRPDLVPEWLEEIPGAAHATLPATDPKTATAVYYVACVNRMFASDEATGVPLPEAIVTVSARAGKPVWIPLDMKGSCCATIWHSKGYDDGNATMANRIVELAWQWTDQGRLPLIVDASSCTLGIAHEVVPYLTEENKGKHDALTVIDSLVWAAQELLPHLEITQRVDRATLHPTCSMRHLDDVEDLKTLAAACAGEVDVPVYAECCGFAGDRGMLHKELTESAARREAAEVVAGDYDAHLCANRTCEIGMEHVTGQPYYSALIALERATRPEAGHGLGDQS